MGNLDIFPVITPSDIVSISKLTPILKIICQSYANHIMTSLIKTITSVLKVLTYIITSIAAGLDLILVIMSVSIIKAAVILYTVKPQCLELGWVEYHGWLELI
jgi:type III secretory pathway component EscU